MKTNQNLVVFQSCKTFKSRFLDLLISTIEVTAEITLLFIVIDLILGYFHIELELNVFAIEGIWDIVGTFIVVLFLNIIFRNLTTTKVDVQNKVLHLRTFSLLSLVTKKNIMEIECIMVRSIKCSWYNVVIVCKGKRISLSINDDAKFTSLLQELNPAIEVEYKD